MRKNPYHDGAADAARFLVPTVLWLAREILLFDTEKINNADLDPVYARLAERLQSEDKTFRGFGDPACATMMGFYDSLITVLATDAKNKAKSKSPIGVLNVIEKGHNINTNAGGSAIVTVDAVLSGVVMTIGTAPGFDESQKMQLDSLVKSLRLELEKLEKTHTDEARAIAVALNSAVANASKAERKPSLLQLSAKGLKEAAELVKDVAPNVLITAELIAKFVLGL